MRHPQLTRLGAALLLAALSLAATAGWGHYDNARFGFGIDVPAGFTSAGETGNGIGQEFATPVARLRAFGEQIFGGDFEAAVGKRQLWSEGQGWTLTGTVSTPSNAQFSGRKGARLLEARMISLCGGSAYAMFELEYSRADLTAFAPVIARLAQSLRGTGECG